MSPEDLFSQFFGGGSMGMGGMFGGSMQQQGPKRVRILTTIMQFPSILTGRVRYRVETSFMFTKSHWKTFTRVRFPSLPCKRVSFVPSAKAVVERRALSRSVPAVMVWV